MKDNESKQTLINCFLKEETSKPFMIVMALLGLLPLSGVMSVTFFAMELFEGKSLEKCQYWLLFGFSRW